MLSCRGGSIPTSPEARASKSQGYMKRFSLARRPNAGVPLMIFQALLFFWDRPLRTS